MEQRNSENQIMRELIACQQRIKNMEKAQTQERETLDQARQLFESLFEFAPDALIVVDRLGRVKRMNTQAERLFGYTREEIIGKDHDVLVPTKSRPKHAVHLKNYMGQPEPRLRMMGLGMELYGLRKDGTEFPADIDLGPIEIEGELVVLSMVRDVTSRKKLEVDLLQSEKRYRELVELSPDAVSITVEDRVVFVNSAGARLFGAKTAGQLVGKPMMELVHPDYRQIVRERFKQVTEDGKMVPLIEEKLLRIDGSAFFADAVSMPHSYQGKSAMVSIIRDINERKKLEDELNQYRQRLEETVAQRTVEFARVNAKLEQEIEEHKRAEEGLLLRANILDNAKDVIILINPEGKFVYVNKTAMSTYGYSESEFLNMNFKQLLPPSDAGKIGPRLKQVLEKGRLDLETIHQRKDHTPLKVEVRHSPLKTLHGQFIVSHIRVLE